MGLPGVGQVHGSVLSNPLKESFFSLSSFIQQKTSAQIEKKERLM